MSTIELDEIKLIGISLGRVTSNENGQSAVDCGNLWQKFEKGNYAEKVPGKLSEDILAVYHQYAGDHTKPYYYFIGCRVSLETEVPHEMESLTIPKGTYEKIFVKGEMPDCVASEWRRIWNSAMPRAYISDFEVYNDKSKDWNNAEVNIFISVK